MAALRLENGSVVDDAAAIARELEPAAIVLESWPVTVNPKVRELLSLEALDEYEKERVLWALDGSFHALNRTVGFTSRDLIVLHGELPGLDAMLARFDRFHRHSDSEARYIIDGEAVFAFARPDGSQIELTVAAGEYVHVPPGVEHLFRLTAARRLKAVRYYSRTDGWAPEYTGTEVRLQALHP